MMIRLKQLVRSAKCVVLSALAATAFGSTAFGDIASETAYVQALLDKYYPGEGWIVHNVTASSSFGEQPAKTIITHPGDRNGGSPSVISRTLTITGADPWLHVNVRSQSGKDWQFIAKVDGVEVYSVLINKTTDIKVPLDGWIGQEVTVELFNEVGGSDKWNYEQAYWDLIEIYDGATREPADLCPATILNQDLATRFPGWTAHRFDADVKPFEDAVCTHPLWKSAETSGYFSRTLTVTGAHPYLHVKVRSNVVNGDLKDFDFIAKVNGMPVRSQTIKSQTATEHKIPLDDWLGQEVTIELHNKAGGSNAWNYENAYWELMEIADGDDADAGLRLSYLRSTGSQYILTGYNAVQDTKLEMEFGDVVPTVNTTIFGKGAWNSKCYLFDILTGGKFCFCGAPVYPGFLDAASEPPVDQTARYWVRVGEGQVQVAENGGEPRVSPDANDVSNAKTGQLAFFGLSSGSYRGIYSFYWAKMWDGSGNLVRDYVPWRNEAGQIGLFDQNAGSFYGKSGSGDFLYGYAYSVVDTNEVKTLRIYDGVLTDRDDLANYQMVEKVSRNALDASSRTAYPGALTLAKGTFALADGVARTHTVSGALALAGGVTVKLDLTAEGCDSFAAQSVDLSGVTIEDPVQLLVQTADDVDYSRTYVIIASGVPTGAESLFALPDDLPMALAVEEGALVMRVVDTTTPVTATWTNGSGDGRLDNLANWAATNGLGTAVSAIPTEKTSVTLPDGCVFNCPAGSTLAFREIFLPSYIGGDCDWSGLAAPIDRTIDLRGYKLRIANLNGTGTITDSTGGAYQRLDYLQSTGTQYINTKYTHGSDTTADLKVSYHAFVADDYPGYFGARNTAKGAPADNAFCAWLHRLSRDTYGKVVHFANVKSSGADTDIATAYDVPWMIHLDNNGPCTIDGRQFDTGVPGANSLNDYLFSVNCNGTTPPIHSIRIYSCKITSGSTVERDFVPVRRVADGVLGMLDLAHLGTDDDFYENDGTGTFIAGDRDPAELPGGEVIVTVPAGETLTDGGLKLTGMVTLVKDGPGTIEWSSTPLADSASVLVTNGVFRTVTSSPTLLGTGGSFKVAGLGQLDINQQGANGVCSVGRRSLFLEGEGPDGSGALVNNSKSSYVAALGRVVLTGDATVGGSSLDVRSDTAPSSEIFGPAYTLTVKTSPFLIMDNGGVISVKSINLSDRGSLAVDYGFSRLEAPGGIWMNGSECSAWSGTMNSTVNLGANAPFWIGADGGTFYNSSVYPYVIPSAVTVADGGTFTIREGTGTYGCVTNGANCTVRAGASNTSATFNGSVRNDGTFELSQGAFSFAASSVLTGSGTIAMTGGTATLAGDVSQFGGEFRVSGGKLNGGFGSFAPVAVIDLSLQEAAVDAEARGWTTAPAGSRIKVDFGSRRVSRTDKVLSWTTPPTGIRYVDVAGQRTLLIQDDGLYASSGLMLILR